FPLSSFFADAGDKAAQVGNAVHELLAQVQDLRMSDVKAITIVKPRFLHLISGTEFESTLKRLIHNRSEETWNLLVESPYFSMLTDYQRMWLESVLEAETIDGPTTLVERGKQPGDIFVIRDGRAKAVWEDGKTVSLGRGEIIGDLQLVHRNEPSPYSVQPDGRLTVFRIRRDALDWFLGLNPGVAVRVPRPVTPP
ncbi:MAG: cyclic nucleotide-binding domain-containing protein, partial [Spirochaetia bacterium]